MATVPAPRFVVINGGSSSGKSAIVRCLQELLPDPWLAFGVDSFVDALPPSMETADGGIDFAADGSVTVGPAFRRLESAWTAGLATMARSGAGIIVDDVFLGGAESQDRWRVALDDLAVLWVGVRCDPEVAAAREQARGDRVTGMARSQAEVVHRGVHYDVEVDTTDADPVACAREIARHLRPG